MKIFLQKFKVVPRDRVVYDFPIDMLRYDRCIPASELDAGRIQATFGRRKNDVEKSEFEINIIRYVGSKIAVPTAARWESFGWNVITESITTEVCS